MDDREEEYTPSSEEILLQELREKDQKINNLTKQLETTEDALNFLIMNGGVTNG